MRFYKILGGMGFTTTLIGMGCMDSSSVALPITMIFAGLVAFCFGMRMSENA